MDDTRLYLMASDVSISEQQESSEIYLLVEARLCSTRPNGNKQGVTEAFIDSIVANQEKYMCLPLYADLPRQLARDYRNLGHRYDRSTGEFHTQQIGSMCLFKKVADEYGYSLMGQARIPKRETEICQRLAELYAMNMLKVSYEIRYVRSDVVMQDDVCFVDASDNNYLTGMCVVSVPAYPESTAQSMIAEDDKEEKPEAHEVEDDPEIDDDKEENEGADKMTLEEAMSTIAQKDQTIAELEGKVAAAEKNAEDIENEKKVKESELAQAESDKNKAAEELSVAQNTISEKEQRIAELEAKIAELEPMKAELETIKAEKEAAALAEKQNKAKSFAERQGLDVEKEEVKNAIASLDYEAIASMAMEIKPDTEQKVTIASFSMTQGIELNDKYGDLLKTR